MLKVLGFAFTIPLVIIIVFIVYAVASDREEDNDFLWWLGLPTETHVGVAVERVSGSTSHTSSEKTGAELWHNRCPMHLPRRS
jgi:hypothetical protein